MIALNLNPITGDLIFDDLPLGMDTEEGFCKSGLYHELIKRKAVNKIMPNHYLVDSVAFSTKNFKLLYAQCAMVFLLCFILLIKIVNTITH